MPRNETVTVVEDLLGVDLLSDATQMDPRRFRRLENFYPSRGSLRIHSKRLGSAKYNATPISGATGLDNGIRAWLPTGAKRLIVAASKAVADEFHYGDDTLGTFTQITGGSALPTGAKWFFKNWPLLSKVYAASGDAVVPIQISSTLTTKTDMTIGAGATDARFGQFLETFFARLITARTPLNPNYYYYFDVASDSVISATNFGRIDEPITAMGRSTFGTQDAALGGTLLLWGANTGWFVPGPPDTTAVRQAPGAPGCRSPKTVVSTPIGTMFLGSDGIVYLIGADPRLPQKVGLRIFPETSVVPISQLADACATYHNGFYKLAVAGAGGTTNATQWWADILPVLVGAGEIEWYGPMTNLALRHFVLFDAPDDGLTLRAGDDTVGTAWKLDAAGYVDGTTTITGKIHSKEFDEGDKLRQKIWPGFTFGYVKSATGTVAVNFVIDSGAQIVTKTLAWVQSGAKWGVAKWGVDKWSGAAFVEEAINLAERLVGRTVQIQMTHSSPTDWKLRDFGRKAKVIGRQI